MRLSVDIESVKEPRFWDSNGNEQFRHDGGGFRFSSLDMSFVLYSIGLHNGAMASFKLERADAVALARAILAANERTT